MSSPELEPVETIQTSREKLRLGEILLLAGSVLSMILACILWSARKPAWMDEIFTWKEATDPSLAHLFWAIEHGADGGQPLFYATVWLWVRIFGSSFLSLRLYSCAAVCAALVVTWRLLRRVYGVWPTFLGIMCVWGTSGLMLDQNAEARFYGLYVLAVAVTFYVCARLAEHKEPSNLILCGAFFCQAALVLTHILGIIYGGLILAALIIFDLSRKWFRPKVYLAYAAGWLALLTWIQAIRASMAAGKPRGWLFPPHLRDVAGSYGLELGWELLVSLHTHWPRIFRPLIFHLPELFVGIIILASVFLLWPSRRWKAGAPEATRVRSALIVAAFATLAMPCVLFVLSRIVTPVLNPRYVLPESVGLAILVASLFDALEANVRSRRANFLRFARWAALSFLLLFPLFSATAATDFAIETRLDIQEIERDTPSDAPVVMEWQQDFTRMMRFSQRPGHVFYLLDWNTALGGPRGNVIDYHLMHAYRDAGYFSSNILDQNTFFCSHPTFYLVDVPTEGWFSRVIAKSPQFAWKKIASINSSNYPRDIYSVHRIAPLPFCSTP